MAVKACLYCVRPIPRGPEQRSCTANGRFPGSGFGRAPRSSRFRQWHNCGALFPYGDEIAQAFDTYHKLKIQIKNLHKTHMLYASFCLIFYAFLTGDK